MIRSGSHVCLSWGEVDGGAKELEREQPSVADAETKVAELIAKQVDAGYVEIEAPAETLDLHGIDRMLEITDAPVLTVEAIAPTLTFASSPALELECWKAPDDPAPWSVYGDWLIARGDVRGELAALRRARKEHDTLRLVATHYNGLFGEHARVLRDSVQALRWRHGFPHRARLEALDHETTSLSIDRYVRGFLASPIAMFVDTLELGLASQRSGNDWGPALRAITSSAQAPWFRELAFDGNPSKTKPGYLTGWHALPRLERLRFRAGGDGALGTFELPALRTLRYESCGLPETQLASITKARWPSLEHLELWLGAAERGAIQSAAPLQPILDGSELPALRHLGLCNSDLVERLIPALAESAVLARLRTLDLSRGTLVSATELVAAAAAFRHLDWISLEHNLLSDEQCARIEAVLPNARLANQRYDGMDDPEDEFARYIAQWE